MVHTGANTSEANTLQKQQRNGSYVRSTLLIRRSGRGGGGNIAMPPGLAPIGAVADGINVNG